MFRNAFSHKKYPQGRNSITFERTGAMLASGKLSLMFGCSVRLVDFPRIARSDEDGVKESSLTGSRGFLGWSFPFRS